MIVIVDRDLSVRLIQQDDFKQFKMVVLHPPAALPEVQQALANVALRLDTAHAWILAQWLSTEDGVARPAAWQQEFGGMLAYATKKGWIDPPTGAIRAHIEWDAA